MYPDEFYEFHPTRKLLNPVNKIVPNSPVRTIHKTKLDSQKKEVSGKINPLKKPVYRIRKIISLDIFTSLIGFFRPGGGRRQHNRVGQRDEEVKPPKHRPEYIALKMVRPRVVSAVVKKKQMIKDPLEPRKIVKPRKMEAKQIQNPIENIKLPKGEVEKSYQNVENKKSAESKKTIKFNTDDRTLRQTGEGWYRTKRVKYNKNKTQLRKSKTYKQDSTHHHPSITGESSQQIFNALQKSGLRKRKGESGQESPQQIYVFRKSEEKTSKVFEFETTISVSLDSGGYLMTIILLSQLIVFGMFLYSRTVTDQKAELED